MVYPMELDRILSRGINVIDNILDFDDAVTALDEQGKTGIYMYTGLSCTEMVQVVRSSKCKGAFASFRDTFSGIDPAFDECIRRLEDMVDRPGCFWCETSETPWKLDMEAVGKGKWRIHFFLDKSLPGLAGPQGK